MGYVYILSNRKHTVLYIGVTNNLQRRLYEHKNEMVDGFTKRYHIHRLVYFEEFDHIDQAIAREKMLKGWRRERKDALITSFNPEWNDLSEGWEK
ncbi:GIY-YIG nuclease family protein [Dialister succinatiphilus]|jgi:putative endonuclease|uniref:GIY-YIG nuclease family protein n=1 Tax=Dialister succinatiphilus TaxID=487173 RepID=UPI0023553525|nr:GIY-YIG nuclease family protein [Dialister succinatiphilus]